MTANNGSNQDRGNTSSGNTNSSTSQGGRRKRKKSRKKPKLDPLKYWGDPTSLPVRNDYVLQSSDPTAVIRSLGKAPIPGKNSAPELYFEVLYKRATGLAQALAFAGSLNQGASDENGSGTTDNNSRGDEGPAAGDLDNG